MLRNSAINCIFTVYSSFFKDLKSLKISKNLEIYINLVGNFDWLLTPRIEHSVKLTLQNGHTYHLQPTSYTIPIVIVILNTAAWPTVGLVGSGPLKYIAYRIAKYRYSV